MPFRFFSRFRLRFMRLPFRLEHGAKHLAEGTGSSKQTTVATLCNLMQHGQLTILSQ